MQTVCNLENGGELLAISEIQSLNELGKSEDMVLFREDAQRVAIFPVMRTRETSLRVGII
jgi:hypothetical protein